MIEQLKQLFRPRAPLVPSQKRRLRRLPCAVPVHCVAYQKAVSATILDMSLSGMRLKMNTPVRPGDRVQVRCLMGPHATYDTVQTKVAWCSKRVEGSYQLGVEYAETGEVLQHSFVKPTLKEIGFEIDGVKERRKSVRLHSEIPVEISCLGLPAAGVALNLSQGGMLVRMETSIETRPVRIRVGPYYNLQALDVRGKALHSAPRRTAWHVNLAFEVKDDVSRALLERYLSAIARL